MSFRDDVAAMLAGSPNAVDILDASGACSRGPREDADDVVADAPGLTTLLGQNASVVIPSHHLSSLAIAQTVTLIDERNVRTQHVVRDIRKIDDGLARRIYLVDA